MQKVCMESFSAKAAATSSCVLRGLLAHTATSAPPAARVVSRLAVSVVTCRQAAILCPVRGFSLANRSLMSLRTGMSLSAHWMRRSPSSARAGLRISLINVFINVVEYIRPVPNVRFYREYSIGSSFRK